MARYVARLMMVVLACAASVGAIAAETSQKGGDRGQSSERRGPERIRWWEDAKWRAELGLSDRQSAEIKNIFEFEMLKLRAMWEERAKREAALAQIMQEKKPHLAELTEQVDRVGAMHAEMYKTRTMMVFRMERVLSAEQRAKLRELFDRMQAERRRSEPNRHR